MTLQPIKDVSEYKRLKQSLRDRFESEKKQVIKRSLKSKRRNINRCCHLRKTFQRLYRMLRIK